MKLYVSLLNRVEKMLVHGDSLLPRVKAYFHSDSQNSEILHAGLASIYVNLFTGVFFVEIY